MPGERRQPALDASIARDPRQDAGHDPQIVEHLLADPDDDDARLDSALDETMDGSDPVQLSPGSENSLRE